MAHIDSDSKKHVTTLPCLASRCWLLSLAHAALAIKSQSSPQHRAAGQYGAAAPSRARDERSRSPRTQPAAPFESRASPVAAASSTWAWDDKLTRFVDKSGNNPTLDSDLDFDMMDPGASSANYVVASRQDDASLLHHSDSAMKSEDVNEQLDRPERSAAAESVFGHPPELDTEMARCDDDDPSAPENADVDNGDDFAGADSDSSEGFIDEVPDLLKARRLAEESERFTARLQERFPVKQEQARKEIESLESELGDPFSQAYASILRIAREQASLDSSHQQHAYTFPLVPVPCDPMHPATTPPLPGLAWDYLKSIAPKKSSSTDHTDHWCSENVIVNLVGIDSDKHAPGSFFCKPCDIRYWVDGNELDLDESLRRLSQDLTHVKANGWSCTDDANIGQFVTLDGARKGTTRAVVPVCHAFHWFVVVGDPDLESPKGQRVGTITILNSMDGRASQVNKRLAKPLMQLLEECPDFAWEQDDWIFARRLHFPVTTSEPR
ncbi:uncharacterized protein MYCFIDRAFT_81750 [Pseudocercospora fijiensis CIRAD86]|uniref:Ubiquitin-like protease family profile domain-containing protein n=1 Tax=Pseudocercospora fijiensis (strain CIRAD86) TaxID=383855 RepID=M2ZWK5_PSEFD|nr:uncharacterized protein MYCFIDRAFT_81750 [Pseudocercospora fijiensis CIRAD86]EME83379.1 hypothetical protein MYCFIDRAFT_81750 [Pseudocercospora fijiensis CIRAD86]